MSPGAIMAHAWNAIIHSGFPLFFWVRPRWSTSDIPDQSGKIVLVTGGNSGTGYATSKALYEAGARVYLCCRDTKRGQKAIEDIKKGGIFGPFGITYPEKAPKKSATGSLHCLELDLADIHSISRFVDDFKGREKRLDLLFANAGVMGSHDAQYTKQGYTLPFGTNSLGHQRLISLLLPLLLESSRSDPSSLPRVINVSSAGHSGAPKSGFDPKSVIRDPSTTTSASGQGKVKKGSNELSLWAEYGQSKWGNVAIANYIHWLYGPSEGRPKKTVRGEKKGGEGEIISVSLHPATNLFHEMSWFVSIIKHVPFMASIITKPADIGASNQIWAATCPEAEARKLSGEYIVPFQRVGVPRPDVYSAKKVEALWDWCEEQGRRHE